MPSVSGISKCPENLITLTEIFSTQLYTVSLSLFLADFNPSSFKYDNSKMANFSLVWKKDIITSLVEPWRYQWEGEDGQGFTVFHVRLPPKTRECELPLNDPLMNPK